jgi:hypothetical protein
MQRMAMAMGLTMLLGFSSGGAVAVFPGEPQYVFVGEDSEGNMVTFTVTQSGLDHQTSCGGMAPLVTSCGSGPHTPVAGPTSYTHGFYFPAFLGPAGSYFGSVSSTITDGVDTRQFVCSTIFGQQGLAIPIPPTFGVYGCVGVGVKPSGTFNQVCKSYFLGTVPAGGVEGGLGDWTCTVQGALGFPAP